VGAFQFLHTVVEDDMHILFFGNLILKDLVGLRLWPVDQNVHLGSEFVQEQALFEYAITSTYYKHRFTFIECPITCGTKMNINANQFIFTWDIESAVASATGK